MDETEMIIAASLKLIGEVLPVGDSEIDERRFKNLQTMCKLCSELLSKIDDVGYFNSSCIEWSKHKAYVFSKQYLDSVGSDNCSKCNA